MKVQVFLRSALAAALLRRGDAPALITADQTISYRQLASGVDDACAKLGADRMLVELEMTNTPQAVVWYLACLALGHPVILTRPGKPSPEAFSPQTRLELTGDGYRLHRLADRPANKTYRGLAVLLATSGSTGSPKLVRLSRQNLLSNARSIATYLGLTGQDRAITTLPANYSYGLSVFNSHLLAGASVVLTETSVIEEAFWNLYNQTQPTSLAGVPYTFNLLDETGFAGRNHHRLRYITQAGGKLDAETVTRYAELGVTNGWQFFVMYGQTEATARISYLPPHLAATNPSSIGHAIPRGTLTIDGDAPTGELIYRGPNVMLGYAHTQADLALGRTVTELRTGDMARKQPNGLFEIVGRASRFAKLYGQRIDLDHLEQNLTACHGSAVVASDDRRLVVGTTRGVDNAKAVEFVVHHLNLPAATVAGVEFEEIPRTSTGKVDYHKLVMLGTALNPTIEQGTSVTDGVVSLYQSELGTSAVTSSSTFVGLGGDSLNYVAVSVGLERLVGDVPDDWSTCTVGELAARKVERGRFFSWVETTILLRAVAIVAIVATHIGLVPFASGGHILLGVAGYNYGRFQRQGDSVPTIARIVVPALLWVAFLWATTDDYPLASLFAVHNWVGEADWSPPWRYWFIEVIVQVLLGMWLVLKIPSVRRNEQAQPFQFALMLFAVALFFRYDPFDWLVDSRIGARTPTVLWAFMAGWAAAVAKTRWQRIAVTLLVAAAVVDFFSSDLRVVLILIGFVLIVWVQAVPVPHVTLGVMAVLANASLYIYLTHWEVYHPVEDRFGGPAALLASLVVGLLVWKAVSYLTPRLFQRLRLDGVYRPQKSVA